MTESRPSLKTVLGTVTSVHKGGNPYHDSRTGRFTNAPDSAQHARDHAKKGKHENHLHDGMSQQEIDDHAEHAMNQYRDEIARGMTPAEAAGWAANSEAESRGDPSMHQRGGPGRGLYQWGATDSAHDRREIFKQQMNTPIESATAAQQRDFRDWELANTERSAKRHIDAATTTAGKSMAITIYYVRPAHARRVADDRAKIAKQIIKNSAKKP